MIPVRYLRDIRFRGSRIRVLTNSGDANENYIKCVIVFLHGSGLTGFGMERWISSLVKTPHKMAILFPSAPMRHYALDGKKSSVWHQRTSLDIDSNFEDLDGIDEMCSGLEHMLKDIRDTGVTDVTLGGFSMGGHLALHACYRHHLLFDKCACLSGYAVNSSSIYSSVLGDKCIPLFMAHGVEDDIVPLSWAEMTKAKLTECGVNIEYHTYKSLKHDINSTELFKLFEWLKNGKS